MSQTSLELEQIRRSEEARATVEELARQQGVRPIEKAEDLLGDFWPEDEDIEDFLAALREWRSEGTTGIIP